jgi:hypothetical protein
MPGSGADTLPLIAGGMVHVKVFISHSTTDQWIARRISQDLAAIGVATFLDEKDIETGDSIDEEIQKHLAECDELLMLLSPAAIKSHWVLVEIGGARALKKRLVPIMLHIGPNDLPAPISKGLARDLNDIEKYYAEVKARIADAARTAHGSSRVATAAPATPSAGAIAAGNPARPTTRPSTGQPVRGSLPAATDHQSELLKELERAVRAGRSRRTFKVGDVVGIPEQRQPDFNGPKGVVEWVEKMDTFKGRTGIVTEVDDDRTVRLDITGGSWWAMDWLEPAAKRAV